MSNGDQKLPKEGTATTFTFKDDTCKIVMRPENGKENVLKVTVRFDPATKNAVDFTPSEGKDKGQELLGIFDLKADTLKLCFPNEPGQDRPKEFESPNGAKLSLIKLKRSKT